MSENRQSKSCLPIDESRLSLGKPLAAFIEDVLVPGRGLNSLWAPGEILPKRFRGSKLLLKRHLFEREVEWHAPSMP